MQKLFGSIPSLIYKMKDETSPMCVPTHTHMFTATQNCPNSTGAFAPHENQLDDQL